MTVKKIGLWGPPKAGKTTYLAALYLEMQKNKEDWVVEATTISDPELDPAPSFKKTDVERVRQGFFPLYTLPETSYRKDFIQFSLTTTTKRFGLPRLKTHTFELWDVSGGFILNSPSGINLDIQADYFQYLSDCDGIIVFVDPQ